MCVLWAPETLGRTLEDIDGVWEERMYKTKHLLKLGKGSEDKPAQEAPQPSTNVDVELTTRV
jgi:hypothetical protein